jgi:transglutaminase-like putative cysteine protease
MPIFRIHHITRYEYDRPVKESMNHILVFPYLHAEQETLQHDLHISGKPELFTYTDYWGNKAGTFNLLAPHRELTIESKLVIRTLAPEKALPLSVMPAALITAPADIRLLALTKPARVKSVAEMQSMTGLLFDESKPVAQIVEDTCRYIFENFTYIKGITNIETTVDEILEKKAGVCQDFAHVMLELLRRMNIPARYVSGYICPNKNGMRGEGATHAWVEAWIPGYGWAGIDPTNNAWVSSHHVKLAVGRSFEDCTPVKGTFKGPARQSLSVYVSVGYEDGVTFEEINSVQLEKQPADVEAELNIDTFAGQQQQ